MTAGEEKLLCRGFENEKTIWKVRNNKIKVQKDYVGHLIVEGGVG